MCSTSSAATLESRASSAWSGLDLGLDLGWGRARARTGLERHVGYRGTVGHALAQRDVQLVDLVRVRVRVRGRIRVGVRVRARVRARISKGVGLGLDVQRVDRLRGVGEAGEQAGQLGGERGERGHHGQLPAAHGQRGVALRVVGALGRG